MIVIMMMWTVSDVFLRYVFSAPIPGTTELTELMMVVAGFPALAWSALRREHIKVDILMSRRSPRVQAIADSIFYLLGLGICILITWRGLVESMVVLRAGLISSVLRVPDFPFHLVLVAGYIVLCVAMVPLLIQSIVKGVKG
jgi:TRAP-type C4-dicarboxylate transport system permease small subunit